VITNLPKLLHPELPKNLNRFKIPLVNANSDSLNGYGFLVEDPEDVVIEITRWPSQGWRNVDEDTGDEGGTIEGVFECEWKGDVLYGKNEAVSGEYTLGYSVDPEKASESNKIDPNNLLMWHANYHPDGGQLFFPLDAKPFVSPLALPGDDVRPEDFVCFYFSGNHGFYIHPNIWHEGIFPIKGKQNFLTKQGAVHARVSVDLAKEFNCLLEVSFADL